MEQEPQRRIRRTSISRSRAEHPQQSFATSCKNGGASHHALPAFYWREGDAAAAGRSLRLEGSLTPSPALGFYVLFSLRNRAAGAATFLKMKRENAISESTKPEAVLALGLHVDVWGKQTNDDNGEDVSSALLERKPPDIGQPYRGQSWWFTRTRRRPHWRRAGVGASAKPGDRGTADGGNATPSRNDSTTIGPVRLPRAAKRRGECAPSP
jgi:hypothetical protein